MNPNPYPIAGPDPKEKLVIWGVVGVGGLIILFALISIGLDTQGYLKAKASRSWPTANAVIITSTVEESTRYVKYQGLKPYFKPVLRYTYAVEGVTYQGNRIALSSFHDDGSPDRSNTANLVSQYPINATVKVYYNPKDPREAILEPGVTNYDFGSLIVEIPVTVMGLFILLVGLFLMRRHSRRVAACLAQSQAPSPPLEFKIAPTPHD